MVWIQGWFWEWKIRDGFETDPEIAVYPGARKRRRAFDRTAPARVANTGLERIGPHRFRRRLAGVFPAEILARIEVELHPSIRTRPAVRHAAPRAYNLQLIARVEFPTTKTARIHG
jgi:hypothetical protein